MANVVCIFYRVLCFSNFINTVNLVFLHGLAMGAPLVQDVKVFTSQKFSLGSMFNVTEPNIHINNFISFNIPCLNTALHVGFCA